MSEKASNKNIPVKTLAVYSVLFYGAWSLVHFFLEPIITEASSEAMKVFLVDGLIKSLIWTLPALLLIHKYKDSTEIGLSEMFTPNKTCVKYLWVFPAMAAYIILGMLIHGQAVAVQESFGLADIIVVIFVGITEELVFRGWLLNTTVSMGEEKALALNAVMFLVIHFPTWICSGIFVSSFTSFGFVSILALSVIFGLLFLRTRNILIPVAAHMLWDLLLFMLY